MPDKLRRFRSAPGTRSGSRSWSFGKCIRRKDGLRRSPKGRGNGGRFQPWTRANSSAYALAGLPILKVARHVSGICRASPAQSRPNRRLAFDPGPRCLAPNALRPLARSSGLLRRTWRQYSLQEATLRSAQPCPRRRVPYTDRDWQTLLTAAKHVRFGRCFRWKCETTCPST